MEMVKFGPLYLAVFLFVYVDCTFDVDVTIVQDGISTTNAQQDKRSPGPEERSEILNKEISKMSSLFDDLNSSLVNILDSVPRNDRKPRVVRDTLINALCEVSEEELQKLFDLNTITTKISNRASENCAQLFLEIENVISAMKNNFATLKNMKESAKINFALQKQKSDNLIVELNQKIKQALSKSSNNEIFKTELNRLMESTHKLKFKAHEFLANLENERTMHRNTKIKLCISEIKANIDFKECVEFLRTEWNNVTVNKYIISNAYEKNEERIAAILKLARAMPNSFTIITTIESLIDEMFKNGQQYSPMIFEIQFYIEWYIRNVNYPTLSDILKSHYENAKQKCENLQATILNTWASDILNGRYDSIINFEFSYLGAFNIVSDKLIEVSYSENLKNAGKIIDFFNQNNEITCLTKMTKHLFNLMQNKNHIFTQQGMQLARRIKFIMNREFTSEIKSVWNEIKYRLPCAIYKVFFENTDLFVKSMNHHEYLYAASFKYDSERRYVFTWRPPGYTVNQGHWKFETSDGKYFTIYNNYFSEYLYAPNNVFLFDSDRRNVFTWHDTSDKLNDKFLWELIPYGEKYFILKNKNYGELLYSADFSPYDDERRRVFTWRPNSDYVGLWNVGEC